MTENFRHSSGNTFYLAAAAAEQVLGKIVWSTFDVHVHLVVLEALANVYVKYLLASFGLTPEDLNVAVTVQPPVPLSSAVPAVSTVSIYFPVIAVLTGIVPAALEPLAGQVVESA